MRYEVRTGSSSSPALSGLVSSLRGDAQHVLLPRDQGLQQDLGGVGGQPALQAGQTQRGQGHQVGVHSASG